MSRADDRLPARFSDPLPKHSGLTREQQDKVVTDYYVELGWDPSTGVPTAGTIRLPGTSAAVTRASDAASGVSEELIDPGSANGASISTRSWRSPSASAS